jgi:dihydroorotate dehydrogenase
VPDWTYHPLFKPLLFRMSAEGARRLTLGLLAVQSKTAVGRRVFRLFGHGIPPKELEVEAFGLTFPAPHGVGPGIDVDGVALGVLQYLGVGFVVAGPARSIAAERRFELDPVRVAPARAIARSALAAAPSAADLAARISGSRGLVVPIGVALAGEDLAAAARAADSAAAFFVAPASAALDRDALAELRAATKRPIVLRLSASWDDATLDRALDLAADVGVDGVVAVAGERTGLLEQGELTGPFLRARRLEVTARVVARFGDRLPVVAAGGVMNPDHAMEALASGARLVELDEGLVYGGPALPGRIVHRLEHAHRGHAHHGPAPRRAAPAPPDLALVQAWGARLIAFTGLVLFASGIAALVLAATVTFFPYDYQFLGMTAGDLCARNACRIVHFMKHDRVSFAGALLSIGAMYVWLGRGPVARGEPWAFWTAAISGAAGFGSFLLYLGYGYLDVWHGVATIALFPFFLIGVAMSFGGLTRPRGPRELLRVGAPAYIWSDAGMGRACLLFAAAGMILGGLAIMGVGVTRVFVPTDLAYLGLAREELAAVSPRLIPLIAHDRAGFGGGLFSGGLIILACVWCGVRPGARGLWWALLVAGVTGFGCAIGVHPLIGYTSFAHLFPAYAGALAFAWGMRLLHPDMCRASPGDRFVEP